MRFFQRGINALLIWPIRAGKAIDQLCSKYLLTERANEGYVVIFDPKTTVGELCTPQERLVQGKKILIFNIGIGR